MAWIPMAAAVPSSVAKTVATTATESVTHRACSMSLRSARRMYQSSVKPPHLARDLEALKERTIITAMGAYRKMRIRAR